MLIENTHAWSLNPSRWTAKWTRDKRADRCGTFIAGSLSDQFIAPNRSGIRVGGLSQDRTCGSPRFLSALSILALNSKSDSVLRALSRNAEVFRSRSACPAIAGFTLCPRSYTFVHDNTPSSTLFWSPRGVGRSRSTPTIPGSIPSLRRGSTPEPSSRTPIRGLSQHFPFASR
jgi:hypothetical protein